MNHPDKVEVPGSGMKNRYRTIIPSKWKICWFVRLIIMAYFHCRRWIRTGILTLIPLLCRIFPLVWIRTLIP